MLHCAAQIALPLHHPYHHTPSPPYRPAVYHSCLPPPSQQLVSYFAHSPPASTTTTTIAASAAPPTPPIIASHPHCTIAQQNNQTTHSLSTAPRRPISRAQARARGARRAQSGIIKLSLFAQPAATNKHALRPSHYLSRRQARPNNQHQVTHHHNNNNNNRLHRSLSTGSQARPDQQPITLGPARRQQFTTLDLAPGPSTFALHYQPINIARARNHWQHCTNRPIAATTTTTPTPRPAQPFIYLSNYLPASPLHQFIAAYLSSRPTKFPGCLYAPSNPSGAARCLRRRCPPRHQHRRPLAYFLARPRRPPAAQPGHRRTQSTPGPAGHPPIARRAAKPPRPPRPGPAQAVRSFASTRPARRPIIARQQRRYPIQPRPAHRTPPARPPPAPRPPTPTAQHRRPAPALPPAGCQRPPAPTTASTTSHRARPSPSP